MIRLLAQDVRVLENFGGLEWQNQTTIHPAGLAMTLVCAVALLLLPRRLAVWPFILLACMVSSAQRVVVVSLDFNLIRLLVIFGAARLLMRQEYAGVRWAAMDGVVVAFALVRTVAYTTLHGTQSAFVFQAGQTFDAVGMYFLFRCLVRSWEDVTRVAVGFSVVSIPVALAFIIEHQTQRNVFSVLGGVPAVTMMREGKLRCQGAFAHPIIAGCFWSGALPLIVALWWQGFSRRWIAVLGSSTAVLIVVLTASSTPVMGVLCAALGAAMFLIRRWMGLICAGTLVIAVGLHFSMKAPIWHLISRITIAKGNTGYHRFLLIDSAVQRFDEWWLCGTASTAEWFWGAQDVTNHYLLEGVRGGVFSVLLFMAIIYLAYRGVGRTWRAFASDQRTEVMAWALGVALFVHCTNFMGVSYFGQGTFIWCLQLALVGSMAEAALTMSSNTVDARALKSCDEAMEWTRSCGSGARPSYP